MRNAKTPILALNIKALRKASGMTQGEFGEKFGGNQKTQWTYEKGAVPGPDYLISICNYYGIGLDLIRDKKLKLDDSGKVINGDSREPRILKLRSTMEKIKKEYQELHDRNMKMIDGVIAEIQKLR